MELLMILPWILYELNQIIILVLGTSSEITYSSFAAPIIFTQKIDLQYDKIHNTLVSVLENHTPV